MSEKPLVYVILGAAGSGRREVLADLASEFIEDGSPSCVLLSETEKPDPFDDKLGGVTRWTWDPQGFIVAVLPAGAETIFFVTDGRMNPVDQMEALKPWIDGQGAELGRILLVVDCKLAESHPPLIAWYEACVHFADVVLLGKREGIPNKWISDFQARFADLHYPCLFEFIKGGRVKNPALILSPVPRRMSHVFEDEQDWIIIDDVEEDEDEELVEGAETEEEIEIAPAEDPYFARRMGGRRVKEIPDIAKFLP